jgi:hypothetical protein
MARSSWNSVKEHERELVAVESPRRPVNVVSRDSKPLRRLEERVEN